MSETRDPKRKYLQITAVVLLVVLLVSAALLLLNWWEKRRGTFSDQEPQELMTSIQYNGAEYVLKENVQTFLVMGLDKFEVAVDNTAYNNDQQADFLALLVIDNATSSYTVLNINRDTMAEMSVLGVAGEKIDTVTKQLALAHTYGNGGKVSCRNTAEAVSKLLLDAKVNHYLSLTMDAVPAVSDHVGGVPVTVLDDFTGLDDTLVKGETVRLKGQQALTYVRSRYGMDDSTNNNRMLRQKQFLQALQGQLEQYAQTDQEFIAEMMAKIANYLVSDCSVNQLQTLFNKLSAYEFKGITSLEGTSVKGEEFMEFHPDAENVKKQVVELFYEKKSN